MRIDAVADRAMIAQLHGGRVRGPWVRLLSAVLHLAGPQADLVRHTEKPWASVTFSGARHFITLTFSGIAASDAADNFIAALPDHEFTIPRQLVADATIASVDQQMLPHPRVSVVAELLLLEED